MKYTLSKTTPTNWDKETFNPYAATRQTIRLLVGSSTTAAIGFINRDGQLASLYAPFIEKEVGNDGVPTNEFIVTGNFSNEIGDFFPGTVNPRFDRHSMMVVASDVAPTYASELSELPQEILEGTKWEKDGGTYKVVLFPTIIPYPFGMTPYTGKINSASVISTFEAMGTGFGNWAKMMAEAFENLEDVGIVIERLFDKYENDRDTFVKYVHPQYQGNYKIGYMSNYCIEPQVVLDKNLCPSAYEELVKIFRTPVVPANTQQTNTQIPQATLPVTLQQALDQRSIRIESAEDAEKKEAANMGRISLFLMFSFNHDDDEISLEAGVRNLTKGVKEPVLNPKVDELLRGSKNNAMTKRLLKFHLKDAFAKQAGGDIFNPAPLISKDASMRHFPETFLNSFLKGDFSTDAIDSPYQQKNSITYEAFAYQSETNPKIKEQIEAEKRHVAQIDMDVPESKRDGIDTLIPYLGDKELGLVQNRGNAANVAEMARALFVPATRANQGQSIIGTLMQHLHHLITSREFKEHNEKNAHKQPHLCYYIHNVGSTIYRLCAKMTEDPNNIRALSQDPPRWKDVNYSHFITAIEVLQNTKRELNMMIGSNAPLSVALAPIWTPNASNPEKMKEKEILESIKAVQYKGGNEGTRNLRGKGKQLQNNDADQRKRSRTLSDVDRRDGPASTIDLKTKGTFVPKKRGDKIVPTDIFPKDLEEPQCKDFHMVGEECVHGKKCRFGHKGIVYLSKSDRKKSLDQAARSGKVYLNPGLQRNNNFMKELSDEHKKALFQNSNGASK